MGAARFLFCIMGRKWASPKYRKENKCFKEENGLRPKTSGNSSIFFFNYNTLKKTGGVAAALSLFCIIIMGRKWAKPVMKVLSLHHKIMFFV